MAHCGIAPAVLGALALGACSMLASSVIDPAAIDPTSGQPACHSYAGAYHLSKAFFRVRVNTDNIANPTKFIFKDLTVNYRPDRKKGYCLDYAASPTAHDVVKVFRVKAERQVKSKDGADKTDDSELAASGSDLLHAISTDAIDESAFILKAIIRTIFIGISDNTAFDPSKAAAAERALAGAAVTNRVLDVEYDPFNLAQSALVNETLRAMGFCIVLQGVTLATPTETINGYCDDPPQALERNRRFAEGLLRAEEARVVRSTRGVLYRPRLPFTVLLFVKANKKVPGGWQLRASEVVELENISPVVSIGIDRAFFAQRKTTVLFDRGVVTNVCIFKTSELVPFVEVPLEIAKSIVALPANIVQVRIDQTANAQRLLVAQNQLLKTEISRWRLEQATTAEQLKAWEEKGKFTPTRGEKGPVKESKSQYEQLLAGLLEKQLAEAAKAGGANAGLLSDFTSICPEPSTKTAAQPG